MPRPKSSLPSYCLNKNTGRAYTTIQGRQFGLGPHGSPESRERFDRLVSEYLARGRTAAVDPVCRFTVSMMLAAFWEHAERYYGADSGELGNYRDALRP